MRRHVEVLRKTTALAAFILTMASTRQTTGSEISLPLTDRPKSLSTATPEQPALVLESAAGDSDVPQPNADQDVPVASDAPEPAGRQILISIPDRKLALLQDGQAVRMFPIAVGAGDTPSPAGEFIIINHAQNPTYRHEGKVIEPGRDNPLGTRWLGLSLKGYGIHGTNVQSSVGKAVSHGCFRMRKKDVEELYQLVQVGDPVIIRADRDEQVARVFGELQQVVVAAAGSQSASADGN